MSGDGYDYKLHANELKDEGNTAFSEGNMEKAIALFTQAIGIDPDNEIFYSNRSAAYMKVDSISKALWDAEKCVSLKPSFAKGYSRLGAAQQGLKRFDDAIDSFTKGIGLDPDNSALWSALNSCKEAKEADKKQKFAAAQAEREADERRRERREEIRAEVAKEKQRQTEEAKAEDLLSGFFAEVPSTAAEAAAAKPAVNEEEADNLLAGFFNDVTAPVAPRVVPKPAEDEEAAGGGITEKYASQDLGDGRAQCARLLNPHREWTNLNPYAVLQLGIDATEEDIKMRFKKLSLRVHPDRLRDIPNAREAFEAVKEAHARLQDPEQKKTIILHSEMVIDELAKERRKMVNKGTAEADLPDYQSELDKRLMMHFAEIERTKRRSETNLRAYSARDKMQAAEEEAKAVKREEFNNNWAEENRREARVGNWRDFQGEPDAKRAKANNFGVERRTDTKHGAADMEGWKKSWK